MKQEVSDAVLWADGRESEVRRDALETSKEKEGEETCRVCRA